MYSTRALAAEFNDEIWNVAPVISKRSDDNATLVARQQAQGGRKTFWDAAWELSLMSVPPNKDWRVGYTNPISEEYQYTAHDSFGAGQVIYVVEDDVDITHTVSQPLPISLPVSSYLHADG
jgi:hypothetical protein